MGAAMEDGHIAVLGTGSWGTTFAQILADAGHDVIMRGRNQVVVDMINDHENSRYVPGLTLSDRVCATIDMEEAVRGASTVVIAVPTKVVGETVKAAHEINPDAIYVSLSKGIDAKTGKLVADVMEEVGGVPADQIAIISGPNLSMEIAEKQPAATVVASSNFDTARTVAKACHNAYFRPYVSTDIIGVQVAGAAKNVVALAIGASEGMGLGANTRATLITRGLAEITRLGKAMGADPITFSGLAGVGDLIATCSSKLSRNYSLGYRMGRGMDLQEALSLSAGVAEGAKTAVPLLEIANRYGVDMPITTGVVEVISGRANVTQMGEMLLGRPQKMDGWEIELLD